jgi:PqqD family protein of HPr-rel-A system
MAMPPTSSHWHLVDPSRLVVRRYLAEGEYLVFDAASGDVHLLNTPGIGILDRLSRSSASLIDLCTTLDAEDPGAVEEAIRHLDRLGLVHPVLP